MPGSHGLRGRTSQIDDVINASREMIDSTFDSPPEGLEGSKAVWMLVTARTREGSASPSLRPRRSAPRRSGAQCDVARCGRRTEPFEHRDLRGSPPQGTRVGAPPRARRRRSGAIQPTLVGIGDMKLRRKRTRKGRHTYGVLNPSRASFSGDREAASREEHFRLETIGPRMSASAGLPGPVVAPTADCAAQRAQYPKDRAQDDQDATEYPKDGAVEVSREDEQVDAKSDQTCSFRCT